MNVFIKNIIYSFLSPILIRRGKKDGIYITFDDGPHPEKTYAMLKALKISNAKATFFMVGKHMEKYPRVVRSVMREGHSIGYHSYSHNSLKKISFVNAVKDIKKAGEFAIKFNINISLYRPPYGDLTPLSLLWLALTGWKTIMWSLDSRDSFDTKEQVLETVSPENVMPGDILLFHDDYDLTVKALPVIVERFKERNLVCKTL